MISNLVKRINSRFFKSETILLGRWNLKHNRNRCEDYILNYHGEPGYPNTKKDIWIEKNIAKSESKS